MVIRWIWDTTFPTTSTTTPAISVPTAPSSMYFYHYCMWIWKGGEEGPASSLGAGRHLLQLYKAGPNFEKVPLVDRLISCFSYFLVLPLCQIGQWCWWRGFSEAESSNPLNIGPCPTSAPHICWSLSGSYSLVCSAKLITGLHSWKRIDTFCDFPYFDVLISKVLYLARW